MPQALKYKKHWVTILLTSMLFWASKTDFEDFKCKNGDIIRDFREKF